MPVHVEALHKIPLFALLNSNSLTQIAAMTREQHYERGDLIVREGEAGGALHYVHAGLVKVFKLSIEGKEQVLFLAVGGETFNDVPALDGGPNPAGAAAMEPSTVYTIGAAELRVLIVTQPDVAAAVVRTLASKLRHLVALVEDLRHMVHITASWREQGARQLPPSLHNDLLAGYFEILTTGYAAHASQAPPPKKAGRKKQQPSLNLLDTFLKRAEQILGFLEDLCVPYNDYALLQ